MTLIDGSFSTSPVFHRLVQGVAAQASLEHLGLHTAEGGLPGAGGLPVEVVQALFRRYDADCSGHVDYEEFSTAILQEDRMHKML